MSAFEMVTQSLHHNDIFVCSFQPVLKRSIIKFDSLQLHGVVAACSPAGSKCLWLGMTGAAAASAGLPAALGKGAALLRPGAQGCSFGLQPRHEINTVGLSSAEARGFSGELYRARGMWRHSGVWMKPEPCGSAAVLGVVPAGRCKNAVLRLRGRRSTDCGVTEVGQSEDKQAQGAGWASPWGQAGRRLDQPPWPRAAERLPGFKFSFEGCGVREGSWAEGGCGCRCGCLSPACALGTFSFSQ